MVVRNGNLCGGVCWVKIETAPANSYGVCYYKYAGPLGLGNGCACVEEMFLPGRVGGSCCGCGPRSGAAGGCAHMALIFWAAEKRRMTEKFGISLTDGGLGNRREGEWVAGVSVN